MLVSVDTYKPEVAEAAVAAGAGMVNDVSGLRDPALADVCARTGAALVVMHTRVARRGRCSTRAPTTTSSRTSSASSPSASSSRARTGWGREQIVLDPGPDFAKTPAQTVAVLRRLDAVRALGRPVLLAVSRKDFLGAITGRAPAERGAATLAAVGAGVDAGASILRVHDVAAAADFLAVRAVLRGERELAPDEGSRPTASRSASLLRARLPAADSTRPGADRPIPKKRRPHVFRARPLRARGVPLADLHVLANELGVDGYRRLRKADLIDAIVAKQAGEDYVAPRPRRDAESRRPRPTPPRTTTMTTTPPLARAAGAVAAAAAPVAPATRTTATTRPRRPSPARAAAAAVAATRTTTPARASDRPRSPSAAAPATRTTTPRRPAAAAAAAAAARRTDKPEAEDKQVEGVVELLGNGSAFVRLSPPETSDEDVYVSAAQVKRCELVSGDKVAGPMRPPRRSERFPSLVRVDTINGKPADEVAEGTRFEDLPVIFPAERLALGSEDPTVKAIEWLTPFGKGSRVTVVGPARAGKSEALRRIAAALAEQDGLELSVVLAGVRPEEVAEWQSGPAAPATAVTFAASADAQGQAVEQAVEQARRVAARGADAVVIVDSLEYVPAGRRARALAAARNIADGGSLTVIASASRRRRSAARRP